MSLKQHEVYLKLGDRMIEESLNHDGFNKTICNDQAMIQFLLALACESIPSHDKELIQTKMRCIYDGCSAKIQSEVKTAILGQPQQPIILPPSRAPATKSKMNDDEEKAVKSSVEACLVTNFNEVCWDKVVLKASLKQMVWDNIIIPLKNHKRKLPGILPGWLIYGCSSTGKSTLINAIMTACKTDGVTYFKVNCAEIFSPWSGMSPKIIKELFAQAHKSGLALIVFDECDALFRYELKNINIKH